jgi:hypothetical protein
MRAITLSLFLVAANAWADMPLQRDELGAEEKTRLLNHARETCGGDLVEVVGFSQEGAEGETWEAFARVYFAPRKAASNLCKSRICTFVSTKPRKKGGRVPGRFTWGRPGSVDTYNVWLAHNGQCLGSPSSKVALYTLIEERTLVSLLDKRDALAEQGRVWLRKNHPDASLMLDDKAGELESISVEDDFDIFKYWLAYRGVRGLLVRVSTKDGQFVVDEAGAPPRP